MLFCFSLFCSRKQARAMSWVLVSQAGDFSIFQISVLGSTFRKVELIFEWIWKD